MIDYEKIKCKCGKQARIVVCGVGTYIDCPYCGAGTNMRSTKEDAIKRFKEQEDRNGSGS